MRTAAHGRRRLAGRFTAVVAAMLVVASVWYVQAPPRTAGAYREQARRTAETLSTQLDTARLWITSLRDGAVTHQAATVAFRETEADAGSAVSKFAAYDPPRGTDALRRDLTTLGDEATSALADLRIVADRGRWAELPDRPTDLAALSLKLEELGRRAVAR